MIDLHAHTTASDGTCSPDALASLAAAAGIRVIGIADHDTTAGLSAAAAACAVRGIILVSGVEITAAAQARDIHVLGYFISDESPELQRLLDRLWSHRAARVSEIIDRLHRAGQELDESAVVGCDVAGSRRSLGRPQVARAMVSAGLVTSVAEAFDRFLSEGRPAYVPHVGISPHEAIAGIRAVGGIAALAHPGTNGRDELIEPLADAGLDAVEAFHSAHDSAATSKYLRIASSLGLLVTGGSDFHGPDARRSEYFGVTSLPLADFSRLLERAAERTRPAGINEPRALMGSRAS